MKLTKEQIQSRIDNYNQKILNLALREDFLATDSQGNLTPEANEIEQRLKEAVQSLKRLIVQLRAL